MPDLPLTHWIVAAMAVVGLGGWTSSSHAAGTEMNASLLIDDFSRSDGVSALGTRWRGFTDQVMGGLSEMQLGYQDSDEGQVLRMRGRVRLENRGGFVQAQLPLTDGRRKFDATPWYGIRIKVRGRPGPYYIHLRGRQTWMPWQYFRAPIEVGEDWLEQVIPFTAFEGRSIGRSLDVSGLETLAVVAYGEAFEAELEVARIELVASGVNGP